MKWNNAEKLVVANLVQAANGNIDWVSTAKTNTTVQEMIAKRGKRAVQQLASAIKCGRASVPARVWGASRSTTPSEALHTGGSSETETQPAQDRGHNFCPDCGFKLRPS